MFYTFSIERFLYQLEDVSKIRLMVMNLLPIKLFFTKWNLDIKSKRDILLFQSMQRRDYDEFTDKILTILPKNSEKIKIKRVFSINIEFLKIPNFEYLELWSHISDLEINLFKKLYIYLLLLYYLSILNELQNLNPKYIILHADMQPLENIIAQYFKSKDIPTVTLQHGLYVDYTKMPNINICSYKHVISEYFLAWGDETKKLINRYHPKCNVIICGTPNKRVEYFQSNSGVFVVLFDGEIFKEYNKNLLKTAQELAKSINKKIYLRLHPANNIEDYSIDNSLILEDNFDIYRADFALGHTTSMIYELMRVGMPVFKYQTNIPANSISKKLVFSNYIELLKKIENLNSIDFVKEGEEYIKYIDMESISEYKKFFQKLEDLN